MAQLRYAPLNGPYHYITSSSTRSVDNRIPSTLAISTKRNQITKLTADSRNQSHLIRAVVGGGDIGCGGGDIGGGGDRDGGGDSDKSGSSWYNYLCGFVNRWIYKVSGDGEFLFKVLLEELVGASTCLLRDMALRSSNFGENELIVVLSTLFVGSVLYLTFLMYRLAAALCVLPLICANSLLIASDSLLIASNSLLTASSSLLTASLVTKSLIRDLVLILCYFWAVLELLGIFLLFSLFLLLLSLVLGQL